MAVHVKLDAVIDTAQPAFLIAAEEQRRGTMRAALVEQAKPSFRVPEQHKIFAKKTHPLRWAVALGDLVAEGRRNPVAPHQLAHWRSGTNASQHLVVFSRQHRMFPP